MYQCDCAPLLAKTAPACCQSGRSAAKSGDDLSDEMLNVKEHAVRQGTLVNDMRYLASVVTQCFTAFGELLALHKRFAELTGGITR